MTTDLRSLYEKYADYVRRLQEDFSRHVGPNVAEPYRPRLMTFDEFCRAWQAWGNVEGRQEMWRRRFEDGYEAVAEELLRRLRAGLRRQDHGASDTSVGRAA